jgi:hypothetical protein
LPPEYPIELLWNGREPDQIFDPNEYLYSRVKEFDIQGKVGIEHIQCPDTSVNRGKFSRPEHVLYARLPKYIHYRVVGFRVSEIPAQAVSDDEQVFDFRIAHDPTLPSENTDENYAHSEIRGFKGIERKKRIPATACKRYRMRLRQVMMPIPIPPQPVVVSD